MEPDGLIPAAHTYSSLLGFLLISSSAILSDQCITYLLFHFFYINRKILDFSVSFFFTDIPCNTTQSSVCHFYNNQIIVFCDGASPYEENAFEAIKEHVMTGELQGIPFFYCRGAWNMEAMNIVDKNLCKMLQKAVAKKDPKDYEIWEKALIEAGQNTKDWTDKAYLKPIIDEIEN